MANIFDAYQRAKSGAMQQGQNAFVMRQALEKNQRDKQLRNVLSSAYQAPMAAAEAQGPVRPGEALQDYPAQKGGFDMDQALQGMMAQGLGPEALRFQQQQASAGAPMRLAKYKDQLSRQRQQDMFSQMKGFMPGGTGGAGGLQPGTTFKMTPRGPEMAFDPAAAATADLAQRKFQYETGQGPAGIPSTGMPPAQPTGMQPAGSPRPDAMLPPAMMANLPPKIQQGLMRKQAELAMSGEQKEVDMTNAARIKAKLKIPTSIMQLDQSNAFVNDLLKHKGLESAFGIEGALYTVPGTQKANFETMKNQLKNSVFITNREALKGGGSITDYEGNKAEESALRADRAQSPAAFKQALKDYQFWTQRAYANLERAAQGDWTVDPNRRKAPPRPGGGGAINRTGQNNQALEWAKNNPNDPRSAQILERLNSARQ